MSVDYAAVTERHKSTWSEGDFHVIALATMPVATSLVEAVDVHGGERVLDVACGSGNVALAAARRHAEATGIDFVPALIERARLRASAEGTTIDFREGDAQALPFPEHCFDVVLSVFGVMFAPDQARAASELLRVTRSGGRLGIVSWMPEHFGGDIFRTHAKYLPPPPGLSPPSRWGTEGGVRELFGDRLRSVTCERHTFFQYFRSVDHALATLASYFGPTRKVLASVDDARRAEFEGELRDVLSRYNRATDGTAKLESTCMRLVATKN